MTTTDNVIAPRTPDPDDGDGADKEHGAGQQEDRNDVPESDASKEVAEPPRGRIVASLEPTKLPAVDLDEPILPSWMGSWESVKTTARRWWRRTWKRTRKIAWNAPKVLLLLVLYSPRGLGRVTADVGKYLYDYDSAQVRHWHASAKGKETDEYVKVQNVRKANLKARWLVASVVTMIVTGPALAYLAPLALGVTVGLVLCVVIVKAIPGRSFGELVAGFLVGCAAGAGAWWGCRYLPDLPAWPFVLVAGAGVVALGWVGRPLGRSLMADLIADNSGPPPLRADLIVGALCSLGSSKMKEPESVRLLGDLHRNGPGVQGELELPPGVTAKFVMENREAFAASLRHPLGTVWPSVGKRHPGHLIVFVSDDVLANAQQDVWPLLRRSEVDLFKPQPNFTDQRGSWVDVLLAYANVIIGAVPRVGKTFILRQLGLVAGLDVRSKVYAYDGKATGDLASLALFAHSYVRGARVDRPEQIDKVRADIAEIRAEMGRRADLLDSLPRELVPESKVTSELCTARPDLQLGPIVFLMDETQMFFDYGSSTNKRHKEIRVEIEEGVTEMVKLGPALGVIVVLATQQVNQKTIPSAIANNAVIRICLKMEGWEPNDRVLGSGAYRRGVDATMFDIDEKGIGYLKAEGSAPRIVRSVFGLDAVASEKVALRARQLRFNAGLLTGHAAGEDMAAEEQQVNLLADAQRAMANYKALHLAELRDAMGALNAHWQELDEAALSSMLRAAGVKVRTVYSTLSRRSERGVKRAWLNVAATSDVDPDELEDIADADWSDDGADSYV